MKKLVVGVASLERLSEVDFGTVYSYLDMKPTPRWFVMVEIPNICEDCVNSYDIEAYFYDFDEACAYVRKIESGEVKSLHDLRPKPCSLTSCPKA